MLQVISIIALIVVLMGVAIWGQKRLEHMHFVNMLWTVFWVYIAGQLYCTLLSRTPGSGRTVELKPFMSIVRMFTQPIEVAGEVTGFFAWFMKGSLPGSGIILNILLFVPLGYLLAILVPAWKSKHIVLVGCMCSVLTELIQYLFEMGYCETDDVLYNTLGTAIGVWVWLWQSKRLNAHRRK